MKIHFIIILLFCFEIQAQDIKFLGWYQSYSQINQFHKFEWKFNFSNTINPKNHQFEGLQYSAGNIRLQIVNTFSYRKNRHFCYSIGLHFQRNFTFDHNYSNEFRPFEQIEYKHEWKSLKLTHMLRLNQRFMENKIDNSYPLTWTIQYKTSLNRILKDFSEGHQHLYLTGFSEEYFTLFGAQNYAFFYEYWAFLGVGYQWADWGRLELGLGHEYLLRNAKRDIRSITYVGLNLITQINWLTHKTS
ncbi:MAG: DUF2490 domain-containing protein [Saprospiraceae bacterium]